MNLVTTPGTRARHLMNKRASTSTKSTHIFGKHVQTVIENDLIGYPNDSGLPFIALV